MTQANTAQAAQEATTSFTKDDMIPMEFWGKGHWSILAYIEAVMVECAGFQVGFDPRMTQNRRNFRVMQEMCPRPKRTSTPHGGVAMDDKWSTLLNNSQRVIGHDDWCCIQDIAAEGLLSATSFEPKDTLHLSEKGKDLAAKLRVHKQEGGMYATFTAH
jgi:hypothetical protein